MFCLLASYDYNERRIIEIEFAESERVATHFLRAVLWTHVFDAVRGSATETPALITRLVERLII